MDQIITTKLTPENRAVVPASVREALGVKAGDQVVYVIHPDGRVDLRTPMQLLVGMWGENSIEAKEGDAQDQVRVQREHDEEIDQLLFQDPYAGLSDDEADALVLSKLGL